MAQEESAERGPVQVEIRVTDPRADEAKQASPFWLSAAIGAFSAALITVAVSLVGLEFFPWYRTPTFKTDELINCSAPIKDAVSTALIEFAIVQAGAIVVGFVVVTTLAYLKLRKRG